MAEKNEIILSIPGLLGSIFAVIIGCLALFTSIPSLGRLAEYGYEVSPAAGGYLFILLGLAGALGSFLNLKNHSTANRVMMLGGLFILPGGAILLFYKEWLAFFIMVIIIAISGSMALTQKGEILLLFTCLSGFPIGQAAIITLPYGWKTWAIPGVLFAFSGLLFLGRTHLSQLPLLNSKRDKTKRIGFFFYGSLALLLIVLSIAFLIHIPSGLGWSSDTEKARGPEMVELAASSQSRNGSNGLDPNSDYCDCENKTATNFAIRSKISNIETKKSLILAPRDVYTFLRGESVRFEAVPRQEHFQYLWTSSLDGIIGKNEMFITKNLTPGWHEITLTITKDNGSLTKDAVEIGIAEPWVCSRVTPRPKYYPVDSPCQDIWPNATTDCQEFEVCHPDLDYIVAEAVDCCDGTPTSGSACAYACNNSGENKKKCRGLYIIKSFGPEAKYMQGYALFKACCSGYPECTRTCGIDLAGTCAFQEDFNRDVRNLSCRSEEWGVSAWQSDQNMSMNSAVLGLFPTHATVNILSTGVCIDYAAAVTTALRKAGYNRLEALSAESTGYDLPLLGNHPGHAYNLVKFPGSPKYYIVDTAGNGDGINLEGLPRYFRFTGCFAGMPVQMKVFDWWVGYCSKTGRYSYNDAGNVITPAKSDIFGCS